MAERATSGPGPSPGASPTEPWTELGRVQRAALAAGAAMAADWAILLARWGEQASSAQTGRGTPRRDTPDPGAVLLGALHQYLSGVADLPRIAGLRFYGELERLGADSRT